MPPLKKKKKKNHRRLSDVSNTHSKDMAEPGYASPSGQFLTSPLQQTSTSRPPVFPTVLQCLHVTDQQTRHFWKWHVLEQQEQAQMVLRKQRNVASLIIRTVCVIKSQFKQLKI